MCRNAEGQKSKNVVVLAEENVEAVLFARKRYFKGVFIPRKPPRKGSSSFSPFSILQKRFDFLFSPLDLAVVLLSSFIASRKNCGLLCHWDVFEMSSKPLCLLALGTYFICVGSRYYFWWLFPSILTNTVQMAGASGASPSVSFSKRSCRGSKLTWIWTTTLSPPTSLT